MFSSEMDRRIIILILTVASTIAQTGLSDTASTVFDPPKVESDNRMFVCYLDRQDSGSKDYYGLTKLWFQVKWNRFQGYKSMYCWAIYLYCQYTYQYWFSSNSNINVNIEILVAIFCLSNININNDFSKIAISILKIRLTCIPDRL